MRRLAKCEQIRESSEIYIISAANSENNTKIRDRKMDIKVFFVEARGARTMESSDEGRISHEGGGPP